MAFSQAQLKLEPTVYIVDDDAEMRSALCRMVRLAGLRAETFDSAVAFLAAYRSDRPGCLLLDVRMPCMSGLELQQRLKLEHVNIPIIFLTGYGNVTAAVSAMKSGALDFFEKPFDNEALLERLHKALQLDETARLASRHHGQVSQLLARLTPREREIMDMLVTGKSNKIIADQLEVSVRTVETHRANIMDKMQAESLADLVRLVLDYKTEKQDH